MPKIIICKNCEEEKEHKGHGLCKNCHQNMLSKKQGKCFNCNEIKRIHRSTPQPVCYTCYNQLNITGTCSKCNKECVIYKRNPDVCKICYTAPCVFCEDCGEYKPHKAHGLCNRCYDIRYFSKIGKCIECGIVKKLKTKNTCDMCIHKLKTKKEACCFCNKVKNITKWIDGKAICYICDRNINKIGFCNTCCEVKPLYSLKQQICFQCYRPPSRMCDFCGNIDIISRIVNNKDMCVKCYNKTEERKIALFNYRANVKPIGKKAWREVMNKTSWKCFYCNILLTNTKNKPDSRTIDHIIPISEGGDNSLDNLVPCCFSCNTSKNNLNVLVWLEISGKKQKILDKHLKILRGSEDANLT